MSNKKESIEIEELVAKAIKNVEEDRGRAGVMLFDLMKYLKGSEDRHKDYGLVANKYLESSQRANEQYIKIMSILSKTDIISNELSEENKEDLLDLLQEQSKEENK